MKICLRKNKSETRQTNYSEQFEIRKTFLSLACFLLIGGVSMDTRESVIDWFTTGNSHHFRNNLAKGKRHNIEVTDSPTNVLSLYVMTGFISERSPSP